MVIFAVDITVGCEWRDEREDGHDTWAASRSARKSARANCWPRSSLEKPRSGGRRLRVDDCRSPVIVYSQAMSG